MNEQNIKWKSDYQEKNLRQDSFSYHPKNPIIVM